MKNLATKNTSDFTVTENGEAFISNRRLSELIDVPESTLRDYFRAQEIVISQGVNAQNMVKAAQNFARKGNRKAMEFVIVLSEAGATAYIYHEAGYTLAVSHPLREGILEEKGYWAIKAQKEVNAALILSKTSSLRLLSQTNQKYGNFIALPAYVEEVKQDRQTLSATELLKRNQASYGKLSAVKFNELALAKGYLEIRDRPSTRGAIKHYKAVSKLGTTFGENQKSFQNPNEEQPLWYSDTFGELLNLLIGKQDEKHSN